MHQISMHQEKDNETLTLLKQLATGIIQSPENAVILANLIIDIIKSSHSSEIDQPIFKLGGKLARRIIK